MQSTTYSNSKNELVQNKYPIGRTNLIKYKFTGIEKREAAKDEIIMDLSEIIKEIEISKYMLEYKDNWDDEGAIAYDYSTWERTTNFLKQMVKKAIDSFGVVIDAPKIYHGDNGGIDMIWEYDKYNLLADFPKDDVQPVCFYGRTTSKETIKGSFMLNDGNNLMMFLIGAKQ